MRDNAGQVNDPAVDELMLGKIGLVVAFAPTMLTIAVLARPALSQIRDAVGKATAHMQHAAA